MDRQVFKEQPRSYNRTCIDCGSPHVKSNALRCLECSIRHERNARSRRAQQSKMQRQAR